MKSPVSILFLLLSLNPGSPFSIDITHDSVAASLEIADAITQVNPDSAIILYNHALSQAQEKDYRDLEGTIYLKIGDALI
ncbi:MAG: hypothetical protein OEQ53_13985, partial [Saprospiraceae bacterium]|nr:hypothetical protein [Saprospiraceae bacterium]